MNLLDLLNAAEKRLVDAGIEGARLDAEVLLAHVLGCGRFELYAHRGEPSEADRRRFEELVRRCAGGCPVAYLTGTKEFWSIPIRVTPAVLIPRPETELVVEVALTHLPSPLPARRSFSGGRGEGQGEGRLLLDLCTGSGCIAAALATELPRARFVVTDASADAIAIARTNLAFAAGRVDFLIGDLFDALQQRPLAGHGSRVTGHGCFDLITSNPPYIPSAEIPGLAREIALFEPREALDGGKCGLDFALRIIENAPRFLKAGGWLVMEMGGTQAGALKEAGENVGWSRIEVFQDLAGVERVTALRKDGPWKNSSSRDPAP